MYDADKTSRRISVIKGEIEKLKTEQTLLLTELQENCVHGNVIESPERFADHKASLRKCLDCDMTESDLFGYTDLKKVAVRVLSSDEFSAMLSREELQYWGR